MSTVLATNESWIKANAPGIKSHVHPLFVTLALAGACHSVDQDIEKFGSVTYETVDQVREALKLARSAR